MQFHFLIKFGKKTRGQESNKGKGKQSLPFPSNETSSLEPPNPLLRLCLAAAKLPPKNLENFWGPAADFGILAPGGQEPDSRSGGFRNLFPESDDFIRDRSPRKIYRI